MTAKGPRKRVPPHYWEGRLSVARAYRQAAENGIALAEAGQRCNPIVSDVVLAVIAYADCLTARRAQVVNQQDHAAAPKLLREVFGNRLPAEQERRYRRILGYKDEAHYGDRASSRAVAEKLVQELTNFADWVEESLRG